MGTRRGPPLYGLDIETDTAAGGLDPARASVVAVAVSARDGDTVFTGPEPRLLQALDDHLGGLAPGVLVTWNGAGFDLPFLADRARVAGVPLGLNLVADATIPQRRGPLAGHACAYRATWHGHAHLDAYRAYKALVAEEELSCSLKAVAERAGLPVVTVDIALLHQLPRHRLLGYVASDASLARRLAAARWADAASFVDANEAFETPRSAVPG